MIKNRKLLMTCLVSGFCIPSLAHADWYVGGEIGMTNADIYDDNSYVEIDTSFPYTLKDSVVDETDTAFKIFGGYNFSNTFAFEFGYANLGEYTQEFFDSTGPDSIDVSTESTAIYASFLGSYQVHDRVNFFARIGLGLYDTEANLDWAISGNTPPSGSSSGSDTNWGPLVGLGMSYEVTDNLDLRFEWEQFQNVGEEAGVIVDYGSSGVYTENYTGAGATVNVLGFSVLYQFGM